MGRVEGILCVGRSCFEIWIAELDGHVDFWTVRFFGQGYTAKNEVCSDVSHVQRPTIRANPSTPKMQNHLAELKPCQGWNK